MHYRVNMSGIIHINGKNYDEEGNLIPPKTQQPKFVDGISPQKASPQKAFKAPEVKKLSLVDSFNSPVMETAQARQQLKPPSTPLQRSNTLLRSIVEKPSNNSINTTSLSDKVSRRRSITMDSVSSYQKHPDAQRLSKSPAQFASRTDAPSIKNHVSYQPIKKTEEMILAQLEAANAHLMTFKKPHIFQKIKKKLNQAPPHKRKFVFGSATAIFSITLVGLIIFSNLASISLSIANKKAGFTAHLPTYTPNGYRVKNPIGYTQGRVVLSFKSNTNDMNYSIEQKPSGWTSETLREQVSSSNGNKFQTQFVNGLTVFFTNDNSATWVDRGVLFTFQGNSGLSSEQIASIAASM